MMKTINEIIIEPHRKVCKMHKKLDKTKKRKIKDVVEKKDYFRNYNKKKTKIIILKSLKI